MEIKQYSEASMSTTFEASFEKINAPLGKPANTFPDDTEFLFVALERNNPFNHAPDKETPAKELAPGLIGHYVHGERLTLGYVEIKAGSNLAEHQHEHEQITYIIAGEMGHDTWRRYPSF